MSPQSISTESKIYIIYFDAASGHRSAAEHIVKACESSGIEGAQMINLTEITDLSPLFGRIIRSGINYFNAAIKYRLLFDLGGLINLSLLFHDTLSKKTVKTLSSFWNDKSPKLVISVTPMYNPLLSRTLQLTHPNTPFLIVPVDMTEEKSRYWFFPKPETYIASATKELTEKALKTGIEKSHIRELSGMPARIAEAGNLNKEALFDEWGFNPEWPSCFVSFGGQGTIEVLRIAKEAEKQKSEANFMFFCGKNTKMFERLTSLKTSYPKKVFAYLPEAPTAYLHLADLVIGKPGAMTLAEAQLAQKPLYALESSGLKLVQKGNEKYIIEQGLGAVFSSIRELIRDITVLPQYQLKLKNSPKNDALDELVQYIEEISEKSNQSSPLNYGQTSTIQTTKQQQTS